MSPDVQLEIYLRERELKELYELEAEHNNELLHVRKKIYKLENKINQLKENEDV